MKISLVLFVLLSLVACSSNDSSKSNLLDEAAEIKAAEQGMKKLIAGKKAVFNCFSFEEFGPTQTLNAYETSDLNNRIVLHYTKKATASKPEVNVYRNAASRLSKGTLIDASNIDLDLRGNYGLSEQWLSDGVLQAKIDNRGRYVLTTDFSIATAKVNVKKSEIECAKAQ